MFICKIVSKLDILLLVFILFYETNSVIYPTVSILKSANYLNI